MKRLIFLVVILLIGISSWYYFHQDSPIVPKLFKIHSRGLEYIVAEGESLPPYCNLPGTLSANRNIICTKGVQVMINDSGQVTEIPETFALTVGNLLDDLQIPLATTDQVTPPLASYLASGLTIRIDRIVSVEKLETSEIVFTRKEILDTTALYGQEILLEAGQNGTAEKNFLITYKNGVEILRILLSSRVAVSPIPEIKKIGRKIEIVESQQGRASWYAYKDCLCGASPHWPKGRFVRVTNVETSKSTIIRINDFGPDQNVFPDRVIDLDRSAYRLLAPLGSGTIQVHVELLK